MSSQLDIILDYYHRGWSVIPVPHGSKKAILRWKKYQTECPAEKLIRKWFGNGPTNAAVVLGEVSGGLTCMDFDDQAAYDLWASKYSEISIMLPTVKTARGSHVYFRSDISKTQKVAFGDFKANGYCLVPPSKHPEGVDYQWIIPPKNGNLLTLNPQQAGFITGNVTEHTEHTEQTEQIQAMLGVGSCVEDAIEKTLPKKYGQRNRMIFEFARALKSLPQFAEAEAEACKKYVQEWHRSALPHIRTKEFEETWIDFLKAWPKVKYPIGKEPIAMLMEKAVRMKPPREALEYYPENQDLQLLASLCRELQRAAGNAPFFLSCRTAGRLLDVSAMTVSRWLFLLKTDGLLNIVEEGGTRESPRKASRYRYIAESM